MATEYDTKQVIADIKAWIDMESNRILAERKEATRNYFFLSSIPEDEDDDDMDSECSCDACNDKAEPVKQKQD